MQICEKLPSNLDAIPQFMQRVLDTIRSLPFKQDDIFNVRISLEEALTNAMRHGNKLDEKLFVEVTVESLDDGVYISIVDEGKGFDFQNIPDPTRMYNIDKPSGRGIFLMRKLMDKVDYSDQGRRVEMVKCFHKDTK